jgi:hypothetical protein
MSLWDSVFGQATQGMYNQGLANQQTSYAQQASLSNSMAQQQMAYYKSLNSGFGQYQPPPLPRFVYENCAMNLEEFAKKLFPEDEQAQLIFILRHTGV